MYECMCIFKRLLFCYYVLFQAKMLIGPIDFKGGYEVLEI